MLRVLRVRLLGGKIVRKCFRFKCLKIELTCDLVILILDGVKGWKVFVFGVGLVRIVNLDSRGYTKFNVYLFIF